jgi:serine phosphatase RsbU (regulator of sigma subunit)/CHASE3 domain sensor protein
VSGSPRPDRRSLRGLLLRLVAALAVVLLLLIVVAVGGTVLTASNYSLAGAQALARQGAANQLLIDMLNADTGSRGYVLTGRDDYLDPYTTAVDRYPADLARLRAQVSGNLTLAADVERANNNAQLWFADNIELIQLRRKGHVQAAQALINEGVAQQWLNAFRDDSAKLAADVGTAKEQSFGTAKDRRDLTLIAVVVAALLAFAVVALTARRLWRRVGDPIGLMVLGVGRVARGRLLEPVPASDSAVRELGELVDGFNTMQRQVFQQRDAVIAAARRETVQRTERRLWETVQQGLLPTRLPGYLGFRLVARYRPAERALLVGGDFYDAEVLADGRLAMIVGDMAGHGASAAAQAAGLRFGWRTMTAVDPDPAHVLTALNAQMARPELRLQGLFATVIYALIDRDGNGIFASAGHPSPLVLGRDQCIALVPAGSGPLLGAMDTADWPTTPFLLGPGETFVLYTDGLLEAGSADNLFGVDRARAVLFQERAAAVEARVERLIEAARRHDVGSLRDDVVVMALERGGMPPRAVGERLDEIS